jgi:hypothetical protein
MIRWLGCFRSPTSLAVSSRSSGSVWIRSLFGHHGKFVRAKRLVSRVTEFGSRACVGRKLRATVLGLWSLSLLTVPYLGNASNILAAPPQAVVVGSGLNHPYAVAVDSAGNVFIADFHNNRVVKVSVGGGGGQRFEFTLWRGSR